MNSLVGHGLILVGAGAAALAVSFAVERREGAELPGGAVQVVVAPRRAASPPEPSTAVPGDRDGLVRAVQRELRRVGCYAGAIDGAWGDAPRRAMRAFLADINASLPVEQPDDILLRLLRGQERRVCYAACPEESATAEGCATDGRLANASARSSPEPTIAAGEAHRQPPAPPIAVEGSPADGAPRLDGGESLAVARSTADPEAPAGPGAPTPPEGLAHRPLAHTRQAKSARPPKLVRKLIRNVQRSLAPLGVR
jgi:hypothetical protein